MKRTIGLFTNQDHHQNKPSATTIQHLTNYLIQQTHIQQNTNMNMSMTLSNQHQKLSIRVNTQKGTLAH